MPKSEILSMPITHFVNKRKGPARSGQEERRQYTHTQTHTEFLANIRTILDSRRNLRSKDRTFVTTEKLNTKNHYTMLLRINNRTSLMSPRFTRFPQQQQQQKTVPKYCVDFNAIRVRPERQTVSSLFSSFRRFAFGLAKLDIDRTPLNLFYSYCCFAFIFVDVFDTDLDSTGHTSSIDSQMSDTNRWMNSHQNTTRNKNSRATFCKFELHHLFFSCKSVYYLYVSLFFSLYEFDSRF